MKKERKKENKERKRADRYRATVRAASANGIRSGKPNGGFEEKKAIKAGKREALRVFARTNENVCNVN